MLAMLGWPEIAVICFVVLLLFGAKKLPELARGMGKGIREFKRASSDIRYELENSQFEEESHSGHPQEKSSTSNSEEPKAKEDQPEKADSAS